MSQLKNVRLASVLVLLALLIALPGTSEGWWRRGRGVVICEPPTWQVEGVVGRYFMKPSPQAPAVPKPMDGYDLWYICTAGNLDPNYTRYWVKILHGQVPATELPDAALPPGAKLANTDSTKWYLDPIPGVACRINTSSSSPSALLTWNTIALWGEKAGPVYKLLEVRPFQCYYGTTTECGTTPSK